MKMSEIKDKMTFNIILFNGDFLKLHYSCFRLTVLVLRFQIDPYKRNNVLIDVL